MTLRYCPDLHSTAGGPDRRRFRRHRLDRPVKLRCDITGRAYAAEGVDASSGGVLLRVQSDQHFDTDQPMCIGIPPRRDSALLLTDNLIEGRVVRCLAHGDARYLAVAFDVPVFMAEAV